MNSFLSALLLLAAAVFSSPVETSADLKAASPLTNCGCQCSPLTFADSQGVVHGNCRTVDASGAQWCYVDAAYSSCQDLTPSARFPSNPWSYEACATPTLAQCSLLTPVAAPHHPVAAPHHPVTAPHHPVAAPHHPVVVAVQPAYPEVPYNPYPEIPPPIDCRVPIAGCPGFSPEVIITPGVAVGPNSVFPDNVRLAPEDSNAVVFQEPTK